MSRRSLFIIFLIILVAASGVFYLSKDDTPARQTPVINDQETSPPAETTSPAFDKARFSLTDPTSSWVIVNKDRPFEPLQYAPTDLVSVGGGQQLRAEAAQALSNVFKAAQAENLLLEPLSGYRSYDRQRTLYQDYVAQYGQAEADTFSARPGHSEHQTGWAIDIGGGGCGIEECFGDTPHGKWVAANAYKYGFIIRYPDGKQAVTGYTYEPWHLRYIGRELASEMHALGSTTLEEFFGL